MALFVLKREGVFSREELWGAGRLCLLTRWWAHGRALCLLVNTHKCTCEPHTSTIPRQRSAIRPTLLPDDDRRVVPAATTKLSSADYTCPRAAAPPGCDGKGSVWAKGSWPVLLPRQSPRHTFRCIFPLKRCTLSWPPHVTGTEPFPLGDKPCSTVPSISSRRPEHLQAEQGQTGEVWTDGEVKGKCSIPPCSSPGTAPELRLVLR